MAGTAEGAIRTAARAVGLSEQEYRARLAAGLKWCTGCRDWHPRSTFAIDRSRGDGLRVRCAAAERARYVPVPLDQRKPFGPPPAPSRDGDARQARARVNVHVRTGRWPHPNEVPCVDCGHVWAEGERRHEHDHHLGYAPEHHEDVEVVCTTCHANREVARRGQ